MAKLVKLTNRQTYKRTNQRPDKTEIIKALYLFVSLSFVSLLVFAALWWFQGWNGRDPANLVISAGDNLWVLAVRPQEHRLVIVSIPPYLVVPVAGKGQWQSRSLWELSQLDGRSQIVESVGWDLMEVPIDDVVRLPRWDGLTTPLGIVITQPLSKSAEVFRLLRFMNTLRQNQVLEVDLADLSLTRTIVGPGGEEMLEIDSNLLSPLVSKWFEVEDFRADAATVSIINTTPEVGSGAKLGRQLQNLGLRVISVTNGQMNKAIFVRTTELKKNSLVQHLGKWLGLPIEIADFDERSEILIAI